MQGKNQITASIKSTIKNALPDAEVVLFGSRAGNTPHDESDWDILILTNQPATPSQKQNLQAKIFPLSVAAGAFINMLLVNREDWFQNPSYYSLKKSITANSILL